MTIPSQQTAPSYWTDARFGRMGTNSGSMPWTMRVICRTLTKSCATFATLRRRHRGNHRVIEATLALFVSVRAPPLLPLVTTGVGKPGAQSRRARLDQHACEVT